MTVRAPGGMPLGLVAALLVAMVAAMPPRATAQTPTADQMIEQLRPPPRTRSLRNLVVEPQARPSLSLQIQFGFDSAEVAPDSRQALLELARALQSQALAGSRFSIEGHTDAKGRADYNQALSQRRADAVRALLAAQGVDAARLVAQGKGASEPADPQDPEAAVNRRVRIVNLD